MTARNLSVQCDSPRSSPSSQDAGQDVSAERRELAQLIGRLLAYRWLAKMRTGRGDRAADTSESPELDKLV